MKQVYSDEFKRKAAILAEDIGISKAAKRLGVPYQTLEKWFYRVWDRETEPTSATEEESQEVEVAVEDNPVEDKEETSAPSINVKDVKKRAFTPEEKIKAVALIEEYGDINDVAQAIKVEPATIAYWRDTLETEGEDALYQIPRRKKLTQEERTKIVETVKQYGVKEAARRLHLNANRIGYVMQNTPDRERQRALYKRKSYTSAEKQNAVRLANEIGNANAALQLHLPYSSICRWTRDAALIGEKNLRGSKESIVYNDAEKQEVVNFVKEFGLTETCAAIRRSPATVKRWMREYGVELPVDEKTDDETQRENNIILEALKILSKRFKSAIV